MTQLNELLGMEQRLTHWQFSQVRRYELAEMVNRIYSLRNQLENYRDRIEEYEQIYGRLDGYHSV